MGIISIDTIRSINNMRILSTYVWLEFLIKPDFIPHQNWGNKIYTQDRNIIKKKTYK